MTILDSDAVRSAGPPEPTSVLPRVLQNVVVHAALYAAILAVLTLSIDLTGGFSSDDGSYGAQVRALEAGDWTIDRPLPVVSAGNEGWINGLVEPDGPVPNHRHPAYIHLLKASASVFGDVLGLHIPLLVGALASAVVAWYLALEFGRREHAAVAFWVVALSPVLINAAALWAHTLGSALGGLAILAFVRLHRGSADGGAPVGLAASAAVLAVALSAGLLVRTENALLVIAVGLGALILRRSAATVIATGAACGVAIATAFVERMAVADLAADGIALAGAEVDSGPGLIASRLPAAWHLLAGTSSDAGLTNYITLLGLLLVLVGSYLARDEERAHLGWFLLGGAAVAYAGRAALADTSFILGITPAWPVVFVALVVGRARAWDQLKTVWVPAGLFTLGVLATQYAESGGLEWGGRYLSAIAVPIAVLVAVRGADLWGPGTPTARRWLLVALVVLPAVAGLRSTNAVREQNQRALDWVTQVEAPVVITEDHALPRLAWDTVPDVAWYRAQETNIEDLLQQLAAADVDHVTVQGLPDVELDGIAGYEATETRPGLRQLRLPG